MPAVHLPATSAPPAPPVRPHADGPRPGRPTWRRPDRRTAAASALVGVLTVAVALPRDLDGDARAALWSFGVAIVLWTLTSWPAAWSALAAVVLLVATGGAEQEALFASLAADVVWLMIGAFVLGAAVTTSGLAARLTAAATSGGRTTVGGVCWRVTWLLVPLSLLVPSTSGRAAVGLPLFRSLTAAAGERAVNRALSLLIPAVVLVSTICTLVGAGSHLVANDLLHAATGERVSFGRWLLWGAPFGIAASALTCLAVQRMFLDRDLRRTPIALPPSAPRRLDDAERRTLAVAAVMVLAWATESVHGTEIAVVAVVGALALTAPRVGVLGWKAGVESVSWNLVVFVGAALVLGEALLDTGAATWVVDGLFTVTGLSDVTSPLAFAAVLVALSLTSHVYLVSHAARAAALVPPLVLAGVEAGLDPVAVMFLATVGMDFCLTFAVSSKALLLYSELDEPTFDPPDLLRLSGVLAVAHAGLVAVFLLTWWSWTGLSL